MKTTLQNWGNSQGIRVPKVFLAAMKLQAGTEVELEMTPKKDALIMRPARKVAGVRGRHRIKDLVASMPKGGSSEVDWGIQGKEVW